jgi:hypothetical protein
MCECIDSDAWVCFRGQNIVGMDLCPCPCHKEAERLELAEQQIEQQRENS